MGRVYNLTGERFGKLTVICRDGTNKNGEKIWLCQCDCGKEKRTTTRNLRSGIVKSCGCLYGMEHHEKGTQESRLYAIWCGMKSRCNNTNRNNYSEYGGRGIKVCDEWNRSFETFKAWAMLNGYRDDLTIDRKDNDGPYSPENCRWATPKEQSNNNRHNHYITAYGKTQTMQQWADETGVSYNTMKTRLRRGETGEAVVCPVEKRTITARWETHTLREWSEITGVPYNTIKTRVRNGKKGEEAIK